jgi:hypothetical protein
MTAETPILAVDDGPAILRYGLELTAQRFR